MVAPLATQVRRAGKGRFGPRALQVVPGRWASPEEVEAIVRSSELFQ